MLLVRYPDGRATGDGYVLFNSERDLSIAMKRNKESMGSRYIELFRSSIKDLVTVSLN